MKVASNRKRPLIVPSLLLPGFQVCAEPIAQVVIRLAKFLCFPSGGLSYHFNIKLYFKRTINASVNFFTLPVVNVGLSTKVGAVFDFFEVVCINCLFFPVSARCTFGYSHELANKPARGLVFFLGQRNLRWPSSFSLWQMSNCGTRDGTRTRKPFQTADFKSAEVTNFSTLALG